MEVNKKGLIFSTDAFFGLVLVVILAAAFSIYYTSGKTNSNINETLNYQTTDNAIVAFYLGRGESGSAQPNAEHAQCITTYHYELTPNAGLPPTQSTVSKQKFCESI